MLFQGGGQAVQLLSEGGQVPLDGIQIEREQALGGVQLVVPAGNAEFTALRRSERAVSIPVRALWASARKLSASPIRLSRALLMFWASR